MRLAVLERGHKLPARLFFAVASRLGGGEDVDDVFKTILYRPALFGGAAWPALIRGALRGPSDWSVGERELFAAAAAEANSCAFCADIHSRTATIALGTDITPKTAKEHRGTSIRPQVKAMLDLIEKVTIAPERLTKADVDAVRAAGASDGAIADAFAICFAFGILSRLADAFEYSWHNDRHREQGARALVRFGYRVPGFLLR